MALDYSKIKNDPETHLKVADPFNLDYAKYQFQKYEDKIQLLITRARDLEVKDDDSNAMAVEMIAQVAGLRKDLNDHRLQVIKEEDKFVRSVNSFVLSFSEKLEAIIKDVLKPKVGDYSYQLELKRREDERIMKEATDKKQAALDAEAKKKKVEPVIMPVMKAPKKREPVRTESGTASTRTVWDCEVVDIEKVPRDYLVFEKSKAMFAIKSGGLRDIPGLRIFEKPIVTVRRG